MLENILYFLGSAVAFLVIWASIWLVFALGSVLGV
jgi:hypothetical protein